MPWIVDDRQPESSPDLAAVLPAEEPGGDVRVVQYLAAAGVLDKVTS